MESKQISLPLRVVLIIFGVVAVSAIALFGLEKVFSETSFKEMPTPATPAVTVAATDTPTPTMIPTARPTETATSTLPATNTPRSSATRTPQQLAEVDQSETATATNTATITPIPSATPTSLPQLIPLHPTFIITDGASSPASTAIPTAVPTFAVPLGTTNVVLIGTDAGGYNMDSIIIVGINRDSKTASMLSIPRDTYVYVVPSQRMGRINTAKTPEQLKQTILYNFGIPIHYYAKVDFSGFKQAVDLVGGIDIAVSCGLRDWRLKSPDLNPNNEDNWEMFTLNPGIHQMDGDFALWYARSRRSTSDFDRGRRQQQILRSMFNQGVDLNLLTQASDLWGTYRDTVETDMDIGRMLQLVTLAPAVRENGVQHLYIARFLKPWRIPVSSGVSPSVQLPQFDEMKETLQHLFLPPALNRATRPPITVEIVNGSGNPEMALLAADNLAWYGFEPSISSEIIENQATTAIQYFGSNMKGSLAWLLGWVFGENSNSVELVTDQPSEFNYRVVLGADYDPCLKSLFYDTFIK